MPRIDRRINRQINVVIPRVLHTQVKDLAERLERSQRSIIIEALEQYVVRGIRNNPDTDSYPINAQQMEDILMSELTIKTANPTVTLELRRNDSGSVSIVAVDQDGEKISSIARFGTDGRLRPMQNVNPELGFQTDDKGRVVINTDPLRRNVNR